MWPHLGLTSDHGVEGPERGALGASERVPVRFLGAQWWEGTCEGLSKEEGGWTKEGHCPGAWVGREEVPSELGRGSWPRTQRLRCW